MFGFLRSVILQNSGSRDLCRNLLPQWRKMPGIIFPVLKWWYFTYWWPQAACWHLRDYLQKYQLWCRLWLLSVRPDVHAQSCRVDKCLDDASSVKHETSFNRRHYAGWVNPQEWNSHSKQLENFSNEMKWSTKLNWGEFASPSSRRQLKLYCHLSDAVGM